MGRPAGGVDTNKRTIHKKSKIQKGDESNATATTADIYKEGKNVADLTDTEKTDAQATGGADAAYGGAAGSPDTQTRQTIFTDTQTHIHT